jgi:hypothetical protein
MRVHVSCPVCRESLEYTHTTEDAYGSVALDDWAIAEITVQDGDGSVREHMNAHIADGSAEKALAHLYQAQKERADYYLKAKEQS